MMSNQQWQWEFNQCVDLYIKQLQAGQTPVLPEIMGIPFSPHAKSNILNTARRRFRDELDDDTAVFEFVKKSANSPIQFWFLLCILIALLSGKPIVAFRSEGMEKRESFTSRVG